MIYEVHVYFTNGESGTSESHAGVTAVLPNQAGYEIVLESGDRIHIPSRRVLRITQHPTSRRVQ